MNDPKRIIIVLLGFALVGLCAFSIKGHIDSKGYKTQVNYTTAVQATEKDKFNYIVDSQQGRVLSSGTFSIDKKNAVKFDEMNQSYSYAKRFVEHNTMHTRQVCTSSGKTTQCHTEVYYTWDWVGEEEKKSDKLSYFGRDYPTGLFNINNLISNTNCEEFMKVGSGKGWFETKKGCLDGYNYIDDDNRYGYETAPRVFTGTFLATTYGGLKPFNGSSIKVEQKSIQKVLKDVGQYKLIGFWLMVVLFIMLLVLAVVLAYAWVMHDGIWSIDS